jgi:hypothetical protein
MDDGLLGELIAMRHRDQEMRDRLVREGRLHGDYDEDMQRVHIETAHRLDALIAGHGWPSLTMVGLEGTRAAWMIAQHSICTPDLQRKFLALITRAAEAGDVPKRQAALLTDRVLACEGRPQIYGTVLDWDANGELSCEVLDPANLDARRQEAGLPVTSEDDLAAHRRAVEAEGGHPPADRDKVLRKRSEWAMRVGWVEDPH